MKRQDQGQAKFFAHGHGHCAEPMRVMGVDEVGFRAETCEFLVVVEQAL